MISIPYQKMICDSDKGDGGISFYEEYCEWINRYNGENIKIFYQDIDDVKITSGIKKTAIVILKNGEKIRFYLYKAATLRQLLFEAVQRVNGEAPAICEPEPEANKEDEDYISKLERLAKLHESGALSDEEFAAAKEKLLK